MAYCGKEVVDLQRLTMGTLVLDENLERGEWVPDQGGVRESPLVAV